MPVGRPSKYDPKYCEMLIEHARKGLSFESFGAVAGVHKSTVYDWIHEHPEFADAKKTADAVSLMFWEETLARGSRGEIDGYNAASAIFALKNRGYSDVQKVEQTTKAEVQLDLSKLSDDEMQRMGELLDKVGK